jgi:phage tail tape-measure protein
MGRKKQKSDESDAHPVGVGVGAATGAATGAVVGSAGGPVGTAVGSVVGGVAGGRRRGRRRGDQPRFEDDYWRELRVAQLRARARTTTFAPAYATAGVLQPAPLQGFDEAESGMVEDGAQ